MRWFADLARLRREHKADGTVVTEADRAVERAVHESLRDRALTLMRGGPR